MIENTIVREYEVAGIQSAIQENPQMSVMTKAVSILLKRSLRLPMLGLPIAVPKLKKSAMFIASDVDSPIEVEKLRNEKRRKT